MVPNGDAMRCSRTRSATAGACPINEPYILDGDLRRRDAEQGDRKNEIGRLRNATHYSHLNAHAHARSYISAHFRSEVTSLENAELHAATERSSSPILQPDA